MTTSTCSSPSRRNGPGAVAVLRLLYRADPMETSLWRAVAARLRGILCRAAGDAPCGVNIESLPGYDHVTGHAKPDESVAAIVERANSRLLWKATGWKILSKVWDRVARGCNTQSPAKVLGSTRFSMSPSSVDPTSRHVLENRRLGSGFQREHGFGLPYHGLAVLRANRLPEMQGMVGGSTTFRTCWKS